MAKTQTLEIVLYGDTARLDEYGAAAIYSTREASVFLTAEEGDVSSALKACLTELISFDFRIIKIENTDTSTIHVQCDELWKQETIGDITIIPVQGTESVLPLVTPPKIPVYVIPGMGFGTGHHPTTYSVIEILQKLPGPSPRSALDIGTGSGLLAVAITRLFSIQVNAFDNDPAAVENARENVLLNGVTSQVSLSVKSVGELASTEERFDLVCANLYSELLVQFAYEITRSVSWGGLLLLSGITESRGNSVIGTFRDKGFILLLENNMQGWVSLLFRNKS